MPQIRSLAFATLSLAPAFACQSGGGGLGDSNDETAGDAADDGTTPGTGSGDGPIVLLCEPDEVQCADQDSLERCAPTGMEWINEDCPVNSTCIPCDGETCAVDYCAGPCDSNTLVPSSAGCSFIAERQLHLDEHLGDSVIVANPNEDLTAQLKWWHTPEGKRKEELIDELELAPGEDVTFEMTQNFVLGDSTMFRTGGIYRVESNVPVIAYQHAPGVNNRGNDSSMLLPESALGQDYVVASYYPHSAQTDGLGRPSYFEVVALEDGTVVEWTPPVPTAGNGLPIDPVGADETGSQTMNRFDTMRIAASGSFEDDWPPDAQDVSGTVIHSNKPIWVVGASRCSRVPVRETPEIGFCDPLQEVMIPLRFWGKSYVAPHPPLRDDEDHYWRIYSGDEFVRITIESDTEVLSEANCTAPNTFSDGACILDQRGSWIEVVVENGQNLYIEGDGPFMPVGYLQSRQGSGEPVEDSTLRGDPAMYQVVPTEQFLSRYVVRTAVGFPNDYIQLIRPANGPDVILDFIPQADWETIGNFEVATREVDEGAHTIYSTGPFGVIQIGLTEDLHYRECNFTPYDGYEEICPGFMTADACNDETQCIWEDGGCVVKKLCRSSYAYPGGMNSEQIFIP
jgi:hypothetical protein